MTFICEFFRGILDLSTKLMSMLASPAQDIITSITVALLVFPPIVVTIINIIQFIRNLAGKDLKWKLLKFTDLYTIIGGTFLSGLLYVMIGFNDYYTAIPIGDLHAPISSYHAFTILSLAMLGHIGYFVLRYYKKQLPPLMFACMIAFVYIEIGICLFWIIQLLKNINDIGSGSAFFILFPVNYILLSIILIKNKLKSLTDELNISCENKFLCLTGKFVVKISNIWAWSFILVIPVIGIAIAFLALFAQEPTSAIKAFTQTSDWTFSQKVSPPPIDAHYLCTVAAGGHKKVVKPLRYGVRHGHKIIVNRQLMVANAFEELISERLHKIHMFIRTNYDRYGYPLSKHISTPLSADFVYILMKPLEWFFLLVLYFFSCNPENRIANQYRDNAKLCE